MEEMDGWEIVGRADDAKSYGFDTQRVDQKVFVPVIWAMICCSFLFLPFRFWTRWRTFRRFFSDDAFVLLAWLCAVAMGALAVYMESAMYWTMRLTLGPIDPSKIRPEDAMKSLKVVRRFSNSTIISFMLMYTSLWLVKLSFLLFFYRLGPRLIHEMKTHWWAVAIFTALAYAATFASYPYMCTFGSFEQITTPYCMAEQNLSFVSMKVNTVLDVLTDVLIMTIPFNILWRSRIPRRQSLALGGVFSLVLVTITFAIVRATVSTVGVTKQMDSPWVLVWSSAEANIAIIVACIGSFRMLFVQNRREDRGPGWRVGMRRRRSKTTTVVVTASVEEMASPTTHSGWDTRGTVESTMETTMPSTIETTVQSTMASENMVSSFSGGWRTTYESQRV